MANKVEFFAVPDIPLVQPGDDLGDILAHALTAAQCPLHDGDVLIVAQKIVSKAEGRLRRLSEVTPSAAAIALAEETAKEPAIVQLVLDESHSIVRHRIGVIIAEHRSGIVLANAGIDRSNVAEDPDWVLLLPEDSNASAAQLRQHLSSVTGKQLGVIIADSVGRAWRMGTTGMTLGSAGVEALVNLRGRKDMFGRVLEVSEHAVADAIAAAAELVMGEADEATPVVIGRGLQQGTANSDASALLRLRHEDMFR